MNRSGAGRASFRCWVFPPPAPCGQERARLAAAGALTAGAHHGHAADRAPAAGRVPQALRSDRIAAFAGDIGLPAALASAGFERRRCRAGGACRLRRGGATRLTLPLFGAGGGSRALAAALALWERMSWFRRPRRNTEVARIELAGAVYSRPVAGRSDRRMSEHAR